MCLDEMKIESFTDSKSLCPNDTKTVRRGEEIKSLFASITNLATRLDELEELVNKIHADIDQQEQYSRRSCLLRHDCNAKKVANKTNYICKKLKTFD